MTTIGTQGIKLHSIQYLRAISAIGVVYTHTIGNGWGMQGVDIFFLSDSLGIVICIAVGIFIFKLLETPVYRLTHKWVA